jgi:acyl CoA:acetate/3-ketoacid CoA transferase alpha subunit/acyl CoA:acetate/3-ketoacid CoA transferase beta subunit
MTPPRFDVAALERRLAVPPVEGPDKVLPLAELVGRHVRPGMTLHLSTAHVRAHGLVYELLRRFRGQTPAFTVVALGVTGAWTALVHTGLAPRVVTSFCGENYPSPAPSPLVDAAWREGRVEIQNWSILTLPLRLLAGAMGLGFLPTRSLLGSTMEEANQGDLRVADDPFDAGGRVALVRALVPDLSLVHGLVADRAGNTLLPPPVGEGVYGALAAREGALVTVERIVPTELIRRHAGFVRLPASRVRAVAEVPLGGHPGGMMSPLVEAPGYGEDYHFARAQRQAFATPAGAEAWLEEWVYGCRAPADFLGRLGDARITALRAAAAPEAWRAELATLAPTIPVTEAWTPEEGLAAAASRRVAARVRAAGLTALLAGIGVSNLAAWLAAYRLRAEAVPVDLMAEIGMVGYLPRAGDPFVFATRNLPTATSLSDVLTVMGQLMGGRWSRCLGVIGAGQVDRSGNVNSTLVPGRRYLTGSGGANDIASTAAEVLVAAMQERHRFVDKVGYVTAPGRAVRTVVSQLGVFERADPHDDLVLTAYLPTAGPAPEAAVEAIRATCGWEVRVAPGLRVEPAPTAEELALLRAFDPYRQFLGPPPAAGGR